jgi:predicted TPR repeat methyltransferase
VLDYGAGQQPYRELVEAAGAAYHPYDRVDFPASVADRDLGDAPLSGNWDTILCTQMLQYVPDVPGLLGSFRQSLQRGGHLLLTYATNWDVIDDADLHRHTPGGMAALLEAAGFTVLVHEKLGSVRLQDFSFPLGYGVVAAV